MNRLKLVVAVAMVACGCVNTNSPTQYKTMSVDPKRDTESARLLNEQALEQIYDGDKTGAMESLQKALLADVTFGPAHNNLGSLYSTQLKLYLAAWEFEYAIRLMPEEPEPHNNLGLVYEKAGRLGEAVGKYELAHSLEPRNPHFLSNLVRAKIRLGDDRSTLYPLLRELLLIETRPNWIKWAEETFARLQGFNVFDQPNTKIEDGANEIEHLPAPIPKELPLNPPASDASRIDEQSSYESGPSFQGLSRNRNSAPEVQRLPYLESEIH